MLLVFVLVGLIRILTCVSPICSSRCVHPWKYFQKCIYWWWCRNVLQSRPHFSLFSYFRPLKTKKKKTQTKTNTNCLIPNIWYIFRCASISCTDGRISLTQIISCPPICKYILSCPTASSISTQVDLFLLSMACNQTKCGKSLFYRRQREGDCAADEDGKA